MWESPESEPAESEEGSLADTEAEVTESDRAGTSEGSLADTEAELGLLQEGDYGDDG